MAAAPPSQSSRSPGEAAPSTVAERYRSLFSIGKGGMGSVEVALERGAGEFKRIVALKRMHPEARDRRHVEMFLREARLAQLLNHPNVVHAFDFGEIGGELFLAMEYVEGMPLSAVLKQAKVKEGGLVPAIVAFMLAEVCDGLHAAHEIRDPSGRLLKVVHRDISPHNVMVAFEGHVKLLDFGVAKMDAEGGLTRTGEVKGKAAYMSPEQAMGDALDRRSDLYAIGAVLFECLTGERMWGDGTDMETLRKLALEEPPALDVAMPHAPPALVSLHRRLVARAPGDRPASAGSVAEELRAYIASTGTLPDANVMRSVMVRLFGDAIAERRRSLDGALGHVAPTRVQVLRESMLSAGITSSQKLAVAEGATVIVAPEAPPTRRSAESDPGLVRSSPGPHATTAPGGAAAGTLTGYAPPASGVSPLVAAAAVLVVMGLLGVGLGVWWGRRADGGATDATATATATPTAISTPTTTPTTTPTATAHGSSAPPLVVGAADDPSLRSGVRPTTAPATATATAAAGRPPPPSGARVVRPPPTATPTATARPAAQPTAPATAPAPKPVDTSAI